MATLRRPALPMSTHRSLLLLTGLLGLAASACATRVVPVQAPRVVQPDGPQAMVFEPAPVDTSAPNPYAPKRSATGPEYSWQSATPSKCGTDPLPAAAPSTVLTFNGPIGVFPVLTNDEASSLQAQLADEAPDTWGTGAHPELEAEHRASNPELVVAGLRPRFRQCFSHWLDAKADAQGSVRFALELGCAGDVQSISAAVQGVDEPTLQCLFAVVAPAQFDPPPAGHASIQVPVVFKNAAR